MLLRSTPLAFLSAAVALASIKTARADQVKSLVRGDQSLSAYYLAIKNAKQTIDVATYLMEPCQSAPKLLLNALAEKARSGVKVRFVIEAWNMKEPNKTRLPEYLWYMSQGNIEVRYYGSSNMLQGDRSRSHVKAFVVDAGSGGAAQIVGGRNWTDEYFGLNAKMNYVDEDLFILGATATNAQRFFEELWKASSARNLGPKPQPNAQMPDATAAWANQCIAQSGRDKSVAQFIQGKAGSILGARPTRSCGDAYYVADNPDFMKHGSIGQNGLDPVRLHQKYATELWLEFLKGTQKKVSLVNQYYMPFYQVKDELARLRTDKRSVEVIANATGDIDDKPMHNASFSCWMQSSAYQTYLGTQRVEMLTSKGSLSDAWSLSVPGAPWRIHAKSGIRDDADVMVSSWNIDPRSYGTNLEDAILIQGCPALATDFNQHYEMLRRFIKLDKSCAACDAEFNRAWLSDKASCGGTPTFY